MEAINVEKPKKLGLRHLQVLMLFFGALLSAFMRVNMSLAIVAMTDRTQEDTFDWNLQTQNIVHSSFKWGYVVLLGGSGELVRLCGAVPLYISANAINSILTLLLPVATTYGGWQAVCAFRSIQGLAQGTQLACYMSLIGRWVPKDEKGRLVSIVFSGANLGTAIQLVTSGYIAELWGWQGIFYVDGILGAVWCIAYFFIGANSPQQSKFISQKEREYIQISLQQEGEQKKLKTPWLAILRSVQVWAVVMPTVGFNWGYWTLLTQIPVYMKQVLGMDIKTNGIMSALPYFAHYILCYPIGYIADYCLARKWMSINVSRKLSNSIATFGPAVALIAMCYSPANIAVFVTLLCCAIGLCAGFLTGDALVYLDMTPNFGSQVFGFSHFVANVVSLCAPIVSGLLVEDETNAAEWRNVFFLAAGFYTVTNIIFLIFGSTEKQPWNDPVVETIDAEADIKKI